MQKGTLILQKDEAICYEEKIKKPVLNWQRFYNIHHSMQQK